MHAFLAAAAMAGSAHLSDDRPVALEAFLSSRKGLLGGRIECVIVPEGENARTNRLVSRFAPNGDRICEERGDQQGWTLYDRNANKGISRYPQIMMVNSQGFWQFQESTTIAKLDPKGEVGRSRRFFDARWVGGFPVDKNLEAGESLKWFESPPGDPVDSWKCERDGAIHVVHGILRSGATMTWFINEESGWNAERIEYVSGSERLEVLNTLARFDELWFPAESQYFANGRLVQTISVVHAELNPPGISRPLSNPRFELYCAFRRFFE